MKQDLQTDRELASEAVLGNQASWRRIFDTTFDSLLALLSYQVGNREEAWWPQLHSFAVGLEGSPDLAAARLVATHIGSIHHEIHFTLQEGLDALRDVIYHLETYDVTTVRASTPMYLMARVIKSVTMWTITPGSASPLLYCPVTSTMTALLTWPIQF